MIGIYQIRNKINDHLYIGKSEDIDRRWKEHTRHLNQDKHHNSNLQLDWNKYGAENYEFKVIEKCPQDELGFKELKNIWVYGYIYSLYNSLGYKDKIVFTLANWLKSIDAKFKVDQKVKIDDKLYNFNLAANVNGKLVYIYLRNMAYDAEKLSISQKKKLDYIAENTGYNRKIIECGYYPWSNFDTWEWAWLDDIKNFIMAA